MVADDSGELPELRVPGKEASCSLRFVAEDSVKARFVHPLSLRTRAKIAASSLKVAYSPGGSDLYWKIGLGVDDVQAAAASRRHCNLSAQMSALSALAPLRHAWEQALEASSGTSDS